jgi:hypothetical protein
MLRCPHCREPLPIRGKRTNGARCPHCREPLFEKPGAQTRAPGPEDGRCAIHPSNAAAGTCARCGNYLCPVCRTRWRDQALCVACVERALGMNEPAPEEARAQRRQAILALLFGLGAWGVLLAAVVLLVAAGALMAMGSDGAAILIVLGALVLLASPLLSLAGVGQGAAAVRTRGSHLILATAGLLLSALHLGLFIGFICSNIWQL